MGKYNWSKLTFCISYKDIFIICLRYCNLSFFQSIIVSLFALAQQPFYLFYIVLFSSKTNILKRIAILNKFPQVDRYNSMEIFNEISFESIKDSFFDIVRYYHQYYVLSNIKPLELIHAIFSIQETKPQWKGILLILELCLCTS